VTIQDIDALLREMAWQRAKGEMRSMLACYHQNEERYTAVKAAIDQAICLVEDEL
jgi:hypothetical protein